MIAKMVGRASRSGRLLVWRAGWLKNQGLRNTRETSLAKWHATEHAVQSALDAIQIHGANGYSNEFPVERYLRNSKAAVIYEGTSQLHTLIQADYALGYREDRPLRCEPWPAQGWERGVPRHDRRAADRRRGPAGWSDAEIATLADPRRDVRPGGAARGRALAAAEALEHGRRPGPGPASSGWPSGCWSRGPANLAPRRRPFGSRDSTRAAASGSCCRWVGSPLALRRSGFQAFRTPADVPRLRRPGRRRGRTRSSPRSATAGRPPRRPTSRRRSDRALPPWLAGAGPTSR